MQHHPPATGSVPNPGIARHDSPIVSSFSGFYSQLLMENPTIPYVWALMHFSLTIICYSRTAFDFFFFANHRLDILFPHSWHFQNITTTSGEGSAEGWSLMLMCPETVNTSGDENSHLRDREGGGIYQMLPGRLILLCWKAGSCLASDALMLYQKPRPTCGESSPEAAVPSQQQQWVCAVPWSWGFAFLGFVVTAYQRQHRVT